MVQTEGDRQHASAAQLAVRLRKAGVRALPIAAESVVAKLTVSPLRVSSRP